EKCVTKRKAPITQDSRSLSNDRGQSHGNRINSYQMKETTMSLPNHPDEVDLDTRISEGVDHLHALTNGQKTAGVFPVVRRGDFRTDKPLFFDPQEDDAEAFVAKAIKHKGGAVYVGAN